MVKPVEARDFSLRNDINLPLKEFDIMNEDRFYGKIEEKHLADFYNFLLKSIDLDFFETGMMLAYFSMKILITNIYNILQDQNILEKATDESEESWQRRKERIKEVLMLFPSINREI